MGIDAGHIQIEQTHQSAVVQPGCAQLQAHWRNAQAARGGIAQQADIVELRAFGRLGPVQAGRPEPRLLGLQRAAQQGQIA